MYYAYYRKLLGSIVLCSIGSIITPQLYAASYLVNPETTEGRESKEWQPGQIWARVNTLTKKIDETLDFCLDNGAYGGKINGSGFGGTLFVFIPYDRDNLMKKLLQKGLKAYPIEFSSGVSEY